MKCSIFLTFSFALLGVASPADTAANTVARRGDHDHHARHGGGKHQFTPCMRTENGTEHCNWGQNNWREWKGKSGKYAPGAKRPLDGVDDDATMSILPINLPEATPGATPEKAPEAKPKEKPKGYLTAYASTGGTDDEKKESGDAMGTDGLTRPAKIRPGSHKEKTAKGEKEKFYGGNGKGSGYGYGHGNKYDEKNKDTPPEPTKKPGAGVGIVTPPAPIQTPVQTPDPVPTPDARQDQQQHQYRRGLRFIA